MRNLNLSKVERTLGSLKFAVIIVVLFSVAMMIGTFVESYYGAEFAGRVVYKTWFFMLIQFFMGVSILFAAFLRLPPKKRLYGFYTIHTGLILIGCGSFITWYAGIDGQIVLNPNEPTREIILSDDIIRISYLDKQKQVSKKLPYTAFQKTLSDNYRDVYLEEYLPYSENETRWAPALETLSDNKIYGSSQYFLSNGNISQEFILSLHPQASSFQSNLDLGPLKVRYLPNSLAPCFGLKNPSKLIIWNSETGDCFTPEQKDIKVLSTETKKRFLVLKDNDGRPLSFLPEESPWPLTLNNESKGFDLIQDSPYRIFSKKIFETSPNLFLFGTQASFYDKDEEVWELKNLKLNQAIDLPWMGFELNLLKHETKLIPTHVPQYALPIQKNGAILQGDQRAVRVNIKGRDYWVTSNSPLSLLIDGERVRIELLKESLMLPFELVLNKFKMDKDPGTNNPASYESFVKLFSSEGPGQHHIFMNNPLKYRGFTFYQASYFQTQSGAYGSSLSANVDPGRWIKYLGSLFLVLGAIWHYYLNKKKINRAAQEVLP